MFVCLDVCAAIGVCECFSLCLRFVCVIARNLSVIAAKVMSIAMASLDLLCVNARVYVCARVSTSRTFRQTLTCSNHRSMTGAELRFPSNVPCCSLALLANDLVPRVSER